jgi:hypothetical protein
MSAYVSENVDNFKTKRNTLLYAPVRQAWRKEQNILFVFWIEFLCIPYL